MEEVRPKMSGVEVYFLIAFALIIDGVNWIPIVNDIADLFSTAAFQIYFFLKGIRGLWSAGGSLLEAFPVISVLPFTTAGIVATVIADRLEAKAMNKLATATASVENVADPNLQTPENTVAGEAELATDVEAEETTKTETTISEEVEPEVKKTEVDEDDEGESEMRPTKKLRYFNNIYDPEANEDVDTEEQKEEEPVKMNF